MNTYSVTVHDDFFGKDLTGEFEAVTEQAAIQEAKEYYAEELDTIPEEIKVVKVTTK